MTKFREPLNTWTHMIGFLIFLIGTIFLLVQATEHASPWAVFAVLVYGIGMLGLYLASTLYHGLNGSPDKIRNLKKIDHSMIYIYIAATYTPICVLSLANTLGYGLLLGVWIVAIIGVIMKIFFLNLPRWLYTSFYLILGWVSLVVVYPLYFTLHWNGLLLLLLGGLFYTTGAIIYAIKPVKIQWKSWGFHEIFHLFIILGSLMHYIVIYRFVLN